jgi:hypothetical protein
MRKITALASIAAAIGVAFYFEFAYCGGRIFPAIAIGASLGFPGALFYLTSYEWGAIPASAAMIVPAIWAYRIECVLPPAGGGAPMAFLAVVMYGLPVALVLGGLVGHATRNGHAG